MDFFGSVSSDYECLPNIGAARYSLKGKFDLYDNK